MSEANAATSNTANSSIMNAVLVKSSPSVWEDVKDSSRVGLNLGITLGVAVVIVGVAVTAVSYLPNGNKSA